MTSKAPRAPQHLAKSTRAWWRGVVGEYELDGHHLKLLRLACEAWDRCQQARATLDRDGLAYIDRFGAPRTRPEVAIERDSRLAFARLLRELNLDAELVESAARPPAIRGIA